MLLRKTSFFAEADNGVVSVRRSFNSGGIYARLTFDQDVAMKSF
jgi:hypothetical protein